MGNIGTSDKGRCWVKCRDFGYGFAAGLCYTEGPGVNGSGLPAKALCYQTLITVLYLAINLSIKYYLVVSN